VVSDDAVSERYEQLLGARSVPAVDVLVLDEVKTVTEKQAALLADVARYPIAGVTARYERLGWNVKVGNDVKDGIIEHGLAEFEHVATANARIKILTLTPEGVEYLTRQGVDVPSWRRGGAAHEYWRAIIRNRLERLGYAVADEYAVAGGFVDLHATKAEHEVFVEIETGKSDVTANIEKCKALDGTVVFFFLSDALRTTYQDAVATNGGARYDTQRHRTTRLTSQVAFSGCRLTGA